MNVSPKPREATLIELANGLENDSYAEAIQRLSDLEWLLHKQLNESIVDGLFTGQLVEASLSLSNNRISVTLQTFNVLPVPLAAPRPVSGHQEFVNDSGFCDNVFKTSTPIRDNGAKLMGKSGADVQRRCLLRQLPECLTIQLMRFQYNMQQGRPTKLRAPVSIRLKGLDLQALVYDTVTQREDLTAPAGGSGSHTYDLYGLCLHLGADSTHHGHYISFCLAADGRWYRFDDETVTEVNMEYELTTREVRQNAYILFYKRAAS
nr:hypothetical protein BaRGS_000847 [Batillaria attramentaria]